MIGPFAAHSRKRPLWQPCTATLLCVLCVVLAQGCRLSQLAFRSHGLARELTEVFRLAQEGQSCAAATVYRTYVQDGGEPSATISGQTVLHKAAQTGCLGLARVALELGVAVDSRNAYGSTPLCHAAFRGDGAMVKMLLGAGASPKVYNKYGDTPLHSCGRHGDPEVVQMLLAAGADPNATASDGTTPLHKFAALGRAKALRLLIKASGDTNKRDADGMTPLDHANLMLTEEERVGVVEALRQAGSQ